MHWQSKAVGRSRRLVLKSSVRNQGPKNGEISHFRQPPGAVLDQNLIRSNDSLGRPQSHNPFVAAFSSCPCKNTLCEQLAPSFWHKASEPQTRRKKSSLSRHDAPTLGAPTDALRCHGSHSMPCASYPTLSILCAPSPRRRPRRRASCVQRTGWAVL